MRERELLLEILEDVQNSPVKTEDALISAMKKIVKVMKGALPTIKKDVGGKHKHLLCGVCDGKPELTDGYNDAIWKAKKTFDRISGE